MVRTICLSMCVKYVYAQPVVVIITGFTAGYFYYIISILVGSTSELGWDRKFRTSFVMSCDIFDPVYVRIREVEPTKILIRSRSNQR